MRKVYVLSESEIELLRKIVDIAIREDEREKIRKIPSEDRLFNDQDLTFAKNFLNKSN